MKAKDCIIATAYHESDIFSELNFHKFYNNENHDVLHYKGLFKNYHSKKVQITWLKDSYSQFSVWKYSLLMLFRNYICIQCIIMPYRGSISNISSPTPYHYCLNIYSFVISCVLLLRLVIFLKMAHDFRSYIMLAIERTTMLDWSHVNDISRKYDYSSLPLIILFWK